MSLEPQLCTGELGISTHGTQLSYSQCVVHRVVKDGWIQSGDIVSGKGSSGESIYGKTFPDESFVVKHDKAGIVAYVVAHVALF
jgi:cyclophilin family peptidyl-prolyl cis-trans isomerase